MRAESLTGSFATAVLWTFPLSLHLGRSCGVNNVGSSAVHPSGWLRSARLGFSIDGGRFDEAVLWARRFRDGGFVEVPVASALGTLLWC